jgi:regulator of replication initiation timing
LTTETELAELKATLDTPKTTQPKPKSALDELKEKLQSLKDVNPALVDSSRIFEHILKDVDMAFVVNATNAKIDDLIEMIATLLAENNELRKSNDAMNSRFTILEDGIKRRDDLDYNFKQRSTQAVEAINQYLRSHP